MKASLFVVGAFLFSLLGFQASAASHGGVSHSGGAVHVGGYTKANGTHVEPHMRSAPDHTTANNWSTKGNVNPYTGKPGTKNPTSGSGTSSAIGSSAGNSGDVGYGGSGSRSENVEAEESGRPAHLTAPTISTEPTTFINPGTAKVVNREEDPILEFQKKSAASGFSESQFGLGMRYLAGDGVPKDEAKGKELIKQASNSSLRARAKMREFEEAERLAKKEVARKAVEENPYLKK
jgi:hypothetical protein